MTAAANQGSARDAHEGRAQLRTNPYVGIAGVFLGATIATLNARLLSVGLPDLRGALGLGFDEASWLPTTLNMAMMFSGCFAVFLSALFGPRRILLPAALVFTCVSGILPFVSAWHLMLAFTLIAGVASGTFYSLTMTFVLTALPRRLIIFGIAAYAADIVFTGNIAPAIEGWYIEHLSWRWLFWNSSVVTAVMMVCVYFGIPRGPVPSQRPSWRGFAYMSFGLAFIYGALDQGERLDWLNSGTIVAMLCAGCFLLAAAVCRRLIQPNPILDLSFLYHRNIIIIALSIFVFKFVQLSTIVLVPGFLSNIQRYRPLDTGQALAWVSVPMFALVWIVAVAVVYTNSRLILALGLSLTAMGCWRFSQLDSSWAGNSFELWELIFATGFACSYVGLVSSLALEGLEAGALSSATKAATLSGLAHFIRLFGGEAGVAYITRFLGVREKLHSNLLGQHVQTGSWISGERLKAVTANLLHRSGSPTEAGYRAAGILGGEVRAQAYTLATSDAFVLLTWVVVAYLLLMLLLRPGKISFKTLRSM
jgi:MFS transporter, DHA2 family, multidrug resistance protein